MCWPTLLKVAPVVISTLFGFKQAKAQAKAIKTQQETQREILAQQEEQTAAAQATSDAQIAAIREQQQRQADLLAAEKAKADKLAAEKAEEARQRQLTAQAQEEDLLQSSLKKKIRRTGTASRRSLFTSAGGGAGYYSRFS
jgi:peptidoglycan hydrolase CwlO-like protein